MQFFLCSNHEIDGATLSQVTRLCESPFISQAFREQERLERVQELEQGGRAAQLKIDHLQVCGFVIKMRRGSAKY